MFQRASTSKIEEILHLIFVEKDTRKKSITLVTFKGKESCLPERQFQENDPHSSSCIPHTHTHTLRIFFALFHANAPEA